MLRVTNFLSMRFILLLLLCITAAPYMAIAEVQLQLCSLVTIQTKQSSIELLDARVYRKEIGKFKIFDKPQWDKVQLQGGFLPALQSLHDSLAAALNMTQHYLIRIRSFYVQETFLKGSSMRYARLHYQADYFAQSKDRSYRLVHSADTSHLMQTYLLPLTAASEIKVLLHSCMIRCKNGLPALTSVQLGELQKTTLLPEREREFPGGHGNDGLYFNWQQLSDNQPQSTQLRILRIAGLGEMKVLDTLSHKKSTLSLFMLYAYMRQGILYKCTRFGSFPLLNINRQFYYVGYHENFFTFRPDLHLSKRLSKKGGYTLTPEDVDHQKYLFRIDALSGRSSVVCSVTPQDDYTHLLMELERE